MHIVGREKLEKFAQRYPNVRSAIKRWVNLIEQGTFRSPVELRETFSSAEPVQVPKKRFGQARSRETVTVFNIGGNKVRLMAAIKYDIQRVTVESVEPHPEYDKGRWRK
ncbi:hypothetical protein C6495_03840 [Candidatus Poribacteria bacterium]|nr:MAG: hypothetical protein C6495_03840 [Candidatus Poribacteria bacterium]